MPEDANIRSVDRQDLPALKTVVEQTGLFPPEMLDDMIAGYFDDDECRDIWLTYVNDGVPIALAFCEPERMTEGTWNLLAIAVHPAHQSKGVGAVMIKHLEGALGARGERILLVETSGHPEFERTRRFYRKNAYTEEARIREFYALGDDKIIFRKALQ